MLSFAQLSGSSGPIQPPSPLPWLDIDPFWHALPRLLDPTSYSPAAWMLVGVTALVLLALLVFVVRVARAHAVAREAESKGEQASEQISVAARNTLPVISNFRDGTSGDPLNLRIIATGAQLGAAFTEAGWYRADEITLVTSVRIAGDLLLGRPYSTAPMSNLYLYGRRQDYGFQKPGRNVRERDHVRLWNSGLKSADGRPLWLGAATRDIDIEISPRTHLPTHKIAPNVDDERDLVIEDLVSAGWVLEQEYVRGMEGPIEAENAYGDTYFTDGMVAALVLADVPVLLPFADDVRGPTLGVARLLSPRLRGRLPRRAIERAQRLRARLRRRQREEEAAAERHEEAVSSTRRDEA